jgi:ubiquinone/menaquinone biosynthesis C-methylase UbiE
VIRRSVTNLAALAAGESAEPGPPASADTQFVGAIPALYESLLVPMIFAEPARSVAESIAALRPATILETAAGTGVLTRELVKIPGILITATDLNPAMLEAARSLLPSHRVHWQVADAMNLPFGTETYDLVACQFGAMFFPDAVGGYAEAARVLRPGGSFVFTVWDRIEHNVVAETVTEALCLAAPADSLDFLRRTPHGHFDVATIERDLGAAGYDDIRIEPRDGTSRTTAHEGAVAYCQGTPLRGEIEQSSLGLDRATAIAAQALETRFGSGTFDASTRWFQITAHCH